MVSTPGMPERARVCLLLGLKLAVAALQRTAVASRLHLCCPLLEEPDLPGGGGRGLTPHHKRAWERLLQALQALLETTPSLRCVGAGRAGDAARLGSARQRL